MIGFLTAVLATTLQGTFPCAHIDAGTCRVVDLVRIADGRELSFRFRRLRFNETHPQESGRFRYLREGIVTLRYGTDALWTRESYWQWEGAGGDAPVHQERTVRFDLMTGESAVLLERMDDATPLVLIEPWHGLPVLFSQALGFLGFDAPHGRVDHVPSPAGGPPSCRVSSPDGTMTFTVEWTSSPRRPRSVWACARGNPAMRLARFFPSPNSPEPAWIVHASRGPDGRIVSLTAFQRLSSLETMEWHESAPVACSVMDLRVPGREVESVSLDRPLPLAQVSAWLPHR